MKEAVQAEKTPLGSCDAVLIKQALVAHASSGASGEGGSFRLADQLIRAFRLVDAATVIPVGPSEARSAG